MSKEITREDAERKKTQVAEFMDRLGEPGRAAEFDEMSVDDYATHRGFRLTNPRTQRRLIMAAPTKADLQDQIDSAVAGLTDAYTPESSREDLAAAVGNALDMLKSLDDDDSDDDDDDSDSDDDSDDDDSDDDSNDDGDDAED